VTQRGWTIHKTFDYSVLIHALYRSDNRGRTKCFQKALTHLIGKALPQRCQIRNLKEISIQYDTLFADFRATANAIVEFGMTHRIVRVPDTPVASASTQDVLFTYLKFFVCMSVNNIPPIRRHMMRLCDWNMFNTRVIRDTRRLNKTILYAKLGLSYGLRSVRVSNKNTMRPTLTHSNFYICRWCAKKKRQRTRDDSPLPLGPNGPRTLARLSRRTNSEAATTIRNFMNTGNRKQMRLGLRNSDISTLASLTRIMRAERIRRDLRVFRNTGDPVNILCYVCTLCTDIKNARQQYTSLCRVVYDIHNSSVHCLAKGCVKKEIIPIPMNMDTIICVKAQYVHFVCNTCLSFSRLSMSDKRRYTLQCEECYVENVS